MSVFELPAYGWQPRADQLPLWNKLVDPDFRRGMLVAHRRYGKDEIGLQATCVKAMQRVGSYAYMLPEYAQARKALWEGVNWRTGRTRIEDAFTPEIVAKRDDQSMLLKLESGSTVQLLGADSYNSIVGTGYAGLVLSEAALCDPRAIDFFRPMLEESRGWELQISTPRGKNNFYKDYLATKIDQDAGDRSVFAAMMSATRTGVFPEHQLLRIKMDLIRKNGKTIGNAIFEQEYLCSFDAAVVGAVWGPELQDLALEGRCLPLRHDRRFPVVTSWDLGVGDPTDILFWQEINGWWHLIDGFESADLGLNTYIDVLKQKRIEKGYHYTQHIGPHDIQQREFARGLSRRDEARRMGLHFERVPQTRLQNQIRAAAMMLPMIKINSESEGAMFAFEKFKGYKYAQNKSTGEIVPTPVHDENSHASSALMTMAVHNAIKIGAHVSAPDNDLHGGVDLGGTKFDPRVYDTNGAFRGGGIAGGVKPQPRRSAFG